MQIHVARDGKELGVFSLEEVNRQLAAGTLKSSDNAWYEGAAGWGPLSSVPGVNVAAAASSAPAVSPVIASTAPIAAAPQAKTEPLAICSLIFSILGLCGFCCGFFLMMAIAGAVCGHLALSKIKQNPQLQGHGLAMAGVVIGYLAIASWLVWIFLFGGMAVLNGIMESMHK